MICSAYGYFGCFTLIQRNDSTDRAPVLWLILEILLAIIRLLVWAWNPRFDENTTLILSYNSNSGATAGSRVNWNVTWGLTLSAESSAGESGTEEPLPPPELHAEEEDNVN